MNNGSRAQAAGQCEDPLHGTGAEDVIDAQGVDPDHGLSPEEARARRREHGPNRLKATQRKSLWTILLNQFKSLVVILLLLASGVALVFGQMVEAIAISAALVINAAIGFFTELSAVRSMEALQKMGQVTARVMRGGEQREVEASELVPGDIVLLREGEVVSADMRLIEAETLQTNESALTGESEPVTKQTDPLQDDDLPLADQLNMAFRGTGISRGEGRGVVVATGPKTEIGQISEMVEQAEKDTAPLQKRLEGLGKRLVWLGAGVGVVVALAGIAAGADMALMIETAIVLAIAAVPEGLPVVATIALGRGMWRMAGRQALVRQLSAVETLGATTVILTDKTGTLTENRMTVRRVALTEGCITLGSDRAGERIDPADTPALTEVLRVGVLCSNAALAGDDDDANGDPMEVALLRAGRDAGMNREDLLKDTPEEREESFSSDTKMMATFHQSGAGHLVAVKGAPEAVIAAATHQVRADKVAPMDDAARDDWLRRNAELAGDGLRVLATARKTADSIEAAPYDDLELLGLVGFYDPPRADVAETIEACRAAGVRVVMATGDQVATARNIGCELGLLDSDEAEVLEGAQLEQADDARIEQIKAFARVDPAHKMQLIAAFQNSGDIVAMIGDGVNDAPALKKADVGLAMGQRGTEVAREAADIVLRDDRLATIVMAIRQARTIFLNIRKFVIYLLSGNLGQILAVSGAVLFGAPLPLLPLQILFLNMVLDVFPALALGIGDDEPSVMDEPPRDPAEPILGRGQWWAITGFAALIGGSVLAVFALALNVYGMSAGQAVTVAFLCYATARLWHIFNMRSADSTVLRNNVVRNPFAWAAIGVSGALLALAIFFPPLATLLGLEVPASASAWALAAAGGLTPLVVGQIALVLLRWQRDG